MTKRGQKIAHCHTKVRDVARGLADANYDELMSFDPLWKAWKAKHPEATKVRLRQLYVNQFWGRYIPMARATMGLLLRDPHLDEKVKDEILEALALDATLIRGRANPAIVAGEIKNST